ncbi:MAG: hypothetical protein JSR45_18255 [Proteobacteria bacterium]|nr:hypothetical protein [Pseudomonadota bacterium]
MHRFVLQANIERFQALIERETDPAQKARLQQLLEAELKALAALDHAEHAGHAPEPKA